ncbi:hypothetical protein OPQ81_008654 [Rhizoctonia solani]|nr:hypothetical protein OPQ81_008654 [Rhizoctonia solani]
MLGPLIIRNDSNASSNKRSPSPSKFRQLTTIFLVVDGIYPTQLAWILLFQSWISAGDLPGKKGSFWMSIF